MENREMNLQMNECRSTLQKLAYKFTNDPEDIQDLVQETLFRALKYVDQFFQNPRLIPWLYVIMRNVYINQFRQQQQKYTYENSKTSEYQDAGCAEPFIVSHVESTLVVKDIYNLLKRFPQQYGEMFTKFIDGYKYSELSDYYNMPEGTIKSRIHIIRKSLRKKLVNYHH